MMWAEKHGPTWRIRDRLGGRPVTLKSGFPTKTAAETAMTLLQADQLRGDQLLPRGGTITLAEWVDEWWPHHERSLKPRSRQSEGGRIRHHIVAMLGGYTLDELETYPMIIQQWVAALSDGVGPMGEGSTRKRRKLGPKTVHNCHGLLYVLLDAAVAAKRLRVNPCVVSSKSLPVRQQREMRFLTNQEITRLIAAMPTHWRPLVLLLVATGLRWGEAVGLRVRNLDLPARKLRVVEALHDLGAEMIWTDPKTRLSRRTVSFTAQVALALAPLVAGRRPEDVVFTSPKGKLVRVRNFRRVWLRACAAAGLEGLRVHDLRHTHAAILIAANRPLSAISRRLGHSSISVTDTLYGHIREEVDEGILIAIDSALAGVDDDADGDVPEEPAGAASVAAVKAEVAEELVGELDEAA